MDRMNARKSLSDEQKIQSSNVSARQSQAVDVYFVGKPYGSLSADQRKAGLLGLVAQDAQRARVLLDRPSTRIAKAVSVEQARIWVNKIQSSGWQVVLVRDGTVCYKSPKTEAKQGRKPLQGAGKAASAVMLSCDQSSAKVRLKRYVDPAGVGSFCVPVQWQSLPQLNANACLAFGDCDTDLYWIAIRQSKQSVGALIPLRQYVDAVCEAATHWVLEGRILGEPQLIDGQSGYQARMSGKVGEKSVCYQIGVYETKKAFYCTYGWTTEAQFSRYRLLFNAMVRSFKDA